MNTRGTYMDEKTKKFLYELANHNIDFLISNLDKVNFGDRDFLIKMMLRLIFRKFQTAFTTGNFKMHLTDLRENLMLLAK